MRPTYKMAVLTTCLSFALFLGTETAAIAGEPRTITMTGLGSVAAPPDQVEIFTSVECDGATAAAALAANSRSMNAVYAVAKKFGLSEKTVATSNFSLQPLREERKAAGNGGITGYRVANSVTISAAEIAKAGALIDALVAAGANQISAVRFSLRDETPLLTVARKAAVTDATEKATTIARAAGVSLGPVLSISEQSDTTAPRITTFKVMAARTPISAGDQTVGASVTITWEIR